MSVITQSILQAVPPKPQSLPSPSKRLRVQHHAIERGFAKSMDEFLFEVRHAFETPLDLKTLQTCSAQLQSECMERLLESNISMLPSYQHTLPTGLESGNFLALDVGGSTFRIALIRLEGEKADREALQVRKTRKFEINEDIRRLQGEAFFDWMAEKIGDMLEEYSHIHGALHVPLHMGVAWSFPVEETSPRSGKLLKMGKGFCATHGIEGQDLSGLIMASCRRRGLNVEMRAIVNDGTATLLAQAYRDPSTRMSLILGTGTNACVFLPVSALGREKFGKRPDSWYAEAKHVLVNTEISMLGKHVLPTTKWDESLNAKHRLPDFQPLEYLTTGRYLGEIVRLILLDAAERIKLFDGRIPKTLEEPYSLETRILASFEKSSPSSLDHAAAAFLHAHPLQSAASPPLQEWAFIRDVIQCVTRRAAAYVATALHALWRIRSQSEGLEPTDAGTLTVACHGTIAELYPGYRARCQEYLDELCVTSGAPRGTIMLVIAADSSVFGAAVAVSCMQNTDR